MNTAYNETLAIPDPPPCARYQFWYSSIQDAMDTLSTLCQVLGTPGLAWLVILPERLGRVRRGREWKREGCKRQGCPIRRQRFSHEIHPIHSQLWVDDYALTWNRGGYSRSRGRGGGGCFTRSHRLVLCLTTACFSSSGLAPFFSSCPPCPLSFLFSFEDFAGVSSLYFYPLHLPTTNRKREGARI